MRRWLKLRVLRLHLALVACTAAFAVLADWQIHRALSGNTLSWAYAFEWPLFIVYAWVLWWRLVADELGFVSRHQHRLPLVGLFVERRARRVESRREEEDEELARYNAYLASLAEKQGRASERGTGAASPG